jgi:ATP-dependent DNA ligase
MVAAACRDRSDPSMLKHLPAGFAIPAQPVMASKPPSGADWVLKVNDGYRLILRRDGAAVRLYTRNALT